MPKLITYTLPLSIYRSALSFYLAIFASSLPVQPLHAKQAESLLRHPSKGEPLSNLNRSFPFSDITLDPEATQPQQINPIELSQTQTPIFPETAPPSLAPLPESEPKPTTLPPAETPAVPESPASIPPNPPLPSPAPGSVPETIIVQSFEVLGSTIFSPEELAKVTDPFTNRPLTFEEVFQVAAAVTKFYTDQGYINSGAFIPPQELQNNVVIVQVLEGGLEAINVAGTRRLRPEYIRNRLAIATSTPFNINDLVEALQLLRLNPLIQSLSTELSASARPGLSVLEVQVEEAHAFEFRAIADNGRTPSVGSFRRGGGISHANLSGFGDELSFDYANTDGSDSFDVSYTWPLNSRNGTIRLAYGTRSNDVIEPPFDVLDLESESRYYELTYRQPIVQTPNQEFTVGFVASRQDAETSLLGFAFPLTPGADDEGRLRVSSLRFFQEWINRSAQQVISARSQFSVGLDVLDSTINSGDVPDSRYFAWRFQGQWVRLLAEDTLFLLRTDLQVANDSLVVFEQFRLGGIDNVRGYRQDLLLTDNGFFASAELRWPILRIPESELVLQLTPFLDYGKGWNQFGLNPDPNQLASIGLGLHLQQSDHLTVRFGWGLALEDVELDERTLQEQGFYFSIRYTPNPF